MISAVGQDAPLFDDIDSELSRLTPVSLSEIDSVSLMNRVDTKYVASDELLPSLLSMLRDSYKVLEVEGVRRSPYESLYFDTERRDCYLDHHNGRASRLKFRQRRYKSSGISFFEVKRKSHGRTDKRRVPIPSIENQLNDESKELLDRTQSKYTQLLPTIWTVFSRITLVGIGIAERVTIDTNLHFSDDSRDQPLDGVMIIEVKQERNQRGSPIRQCLRQLGVRPMRFSKYCIGSAMLDPNLKRNRFKRKLMAVGSHAS